MSTSWIFVGAQTENRSIVNLYLYPIVKCFVFGLVLRMLCSLVEENVVCEVTPKPVYIIMMILVLLFGYMADGSLDSYVPWVKLMIGAKYIGLLIVALIVLDLICKSVDISPANRPSGLLVRLVTLSTNLFAILGSVFARLFDWQLWFTYLRDMWDYLVTQFCRFMDWVFPFLRPIWESARDVLSPIVSLLLSPFSGFFQGIKEYMTGIYDTRLYKDLATYSASIYSSVFG